MTDINNKIKSFLEENGIIAIPKYLDKGSLKGCIRIYNKNMQWWNNFELQNKFKELGFVDYDGRELHNYSGNGGIFQVFVRPGNRELHNKLFN